MSITLIALSDLVPILGGATVIGGKRLRLFNDGRPTVAITKHISQPVRTVQNIPPVEPTEIELPERLSPDGEENEIQVENNVQVPDEDLDSWSDWDHEDSNNQRSENLQEIQPNSPEITMSELQASNILRLSSKTLPRPPEIVTDILSLDIKNQKDNKDDNHELDFFSDMEPVIEKTNKVFIEKNESEKITHDLNNVNLAMTNDEDNMVDEDCWGDDLSWVKN